MRYLYSLSLILAVAASACGESDPTTPVQPGPPTSSVLLQDVVLSHLPSPYYHFEYDADGRVVAASFASGLRMYDVRYDGDRIEEMREVTNLGGVIVPAGDRLEYFYDTAGRVGLITYVNTDGQPFTRVFFSYDGAKLIELVRQQNGDSGWVVDKTVSLSYGSDGNLLELTEHRPSLDGQPETTTVDRYEQYDDGVNVDGFGLIHDDFFDHLFLLPGVQIQRNNPGRQTRSGDGPHFVVDYVYTYDAEHRPLRRLGDLTFTSGADTGSEFQLRSDYSYY